MIMRYNIENGKKYKHLIMRMMDNWKSFPFTLYELSSLIDNLPADWNRINVCD